MSFESSNFFLEIKTKKNLHGFMNSVKYRGSFTCTKKLILVRIVNIAGIFFAYYLTKLLQFFLLNNVSDFNWYCYRQAYGCRRQWMRGLDLISFILNEQKLVDLYRPSSTR